jgi:hypothetical protein
MTGQKSFPPPAPFLLYLISRKTKSPKTADISRPFQGFSLQTKGYVEKCLLPITFLFSGKNFFLAMKTRLCQRLFSASHLRQTAIADELQRSVNIPERLVPRMNPASSTRFMRGTMRLYVPPSRQRRASMSFAAWYKKVTDLKPFTKDIKCDIFNLGLRNLPPHFQSKLRRLKG